MRAARVRYIVSGAILMVSVVVQADVTQVKPSSFTDSLFRKYGGNCSLDFSKLSHDLHIGSKSGADTAQDNGQHVENKCFSESSLLSVFSINNTQLNKEEFAKICPAVVQQAVSKTCVHNLLHDGRKKPVSREPRAKAWAYGVLSVGVLSAAPLIGVFVVPFMSHQVYKTVLLFMVSLAVGVLGGGSVYHLIPGVSNIDNERLFMVSLAVGVLGGGSVYHLIPGAFGLRSDGHAYLFKSTTLVGGIYLFFVVEYVLRMFVRFKEKTESQQDPTGGHGHSHQLQPPSFKYKKSVRKESLADKQSVFSNVTQDHHRAHTNSVCINNEINDNMEKAENETRAMTPERQTSVMAPETQTTTAVRQTSVESIYATEESREILKEQNPSAVQVKPIAWMIVIGDCLHNLIDGIAIGAAFSSSMVEGFSTALAICGEEIPHELGDFAVLLSAGMKYKHAILFNLLSGLVCLLGLIIGLLLGYATQSVQWIYALAAGMFLYISLVDMLPEATEMSFKEGEGSLKKNLKTFALQNFGMLFGFAVMFVLALYSDEIQL